MRLHTMSVIMSWLELPSMGCPRPVRYRKWPKMTGNSSILVSDRGGWNTIQ
jgi:hypothetical protein